MLELGVIVEDGRHQERFSAPTWERRPLHLGVDQNAVADAGMPVRDGMEQPVPPIRRTDRAMGVLSGW